MSAAVVVSDRVLPGQVLSDGRVVVEVRRRQSVLLVLDDGVYRYVPRGQRVTLAEADVVPDSVPAEWSQ